jgi:pimeloyl-ACP methyl ester carboxylesterase
MKNTFEYKSGTISYSSYGAGNVIVLLHGYLESEQIWEKFALKLSLKFRVICIDLPGHGSSGTYGEIHTMEFMAAAVKSLVDSIGIKKFFLAGHSLGGYVALAFLELFPDSLAGYCLFHSQPFADQPQAIEKRKREIELVKAGKKNLMYPLNVEKMFANSNLDKFSDALKQSMKIASETPDDGIIAILNGMIARPARLSFLEAGRVPLLWILGSQDNYISLDILDRVKLPESAEVVILINSGHLGFIEEEEESLKAMEDFIARLT